jgi:hypothetical protein
MQRTVSDSDEKGSSLDHSSTSTLREGYGSSSLPLRKQVLTAVPPAFLGVGTSGVVLFADVPMSAKNATRFECFPYVCPEPVLVK